MRRVLGLAIAGPTGIGKTDVAERLARLLDGELLSVDSVQVYRGLVVGANKTPTAVPQHMLDVACVSEGATGLSFAPFSSAAFVDRATAVIRGIVARQKTPILVGGTGMYMDWLVRGRPTAPASDPAVRASVEAELLADGDDWPRSLARLAAVDPAYASGLLANDRYRLVRALTVHRMTGRPLSSFGALAHQDVGVEWRCFYLAPTDRVAFMRHLDRRCEAMVVRGLLAEVLGLRRAGLSRESCAGRAIGYAAALDFLDAIGAHAADAAAQPDGDAARTVDAACVAFVQRLQAETRQYARKQDRWFADEDRGASFVRVARPLDVSFEAVADAIHACVVRGAEIPPVREAVDHAALRRYAPRLELLGTPEARRSLLSPLLPLFSDLQS